jgi:hypothetical protein
VAPGLLGQVGGGPQGLVLGGEPGHRLLAVGDRRGGDAGGRRAGPGHAEAAVPLEPAVGSQRRVQVVVEEAELGVVVGRRERAGVVAQQVVAAEPAGLGRRHQVGLDQLGQQRAQAGDRQRGQAGQRVGPGDGCGVQADQPEQPRGGGAEFAVRPGEHRPHVGGRVVAGERVEPGRAQLGGDVGEREPGVGGGAGGHDGQGERQVRADLGDLVDRARLGPYPIGSYPPRQQGPGLVGAEHVQQQQSRTVGDSEAGEPVTAGHHHDAAGHAGQQRADLGGVGGVVEQDQHPAAGERAAVQRRAGAEVGRHPLRRHAEPVEHAAQRVAGGHRRTGRAETAQVDVELPVGEVVPHPMGPAHGEGGLADPGRPGHRRDDHAAGEGQEPVEERQLPVPAGEARRVERQLGGGDLVRGRLEELVEQRAGEAESRRQRPQGRHPRRGDLPGLPLPDAAHADPGPVGQILLGHAEPAAVAAHQVPEHRITPKPIDLPRSSQARASPGDKRPTAKCR